MPNLDVKIFYILGLITLFPLGLVAQDHDIDVIISAETIIGDDGTINVQINDVFSEIDNPGGINNPPFTFEWTYNNATLPSSTYDVDELLGSCLLVELAPGEYCVTITQNANTDFACSVEGCFVIEAFDPGVFSIGIDAPFTANVDEVFTISATGGNNGGGNITWNWSIPDAAPNSANDQSLDISYFTPGVKTITLNAVNDAGQTDQVTHQINITTGLSVDFDFTQTSFSSSGLGFGAFFRANVTGGTGHLSYKWDFGDGQTSPDLGIDFTNHFYAEHGVYTVTLTVTDAAGISSITKNVLIITNEFSVIITAPAETKFIPAGESVDFTALVQNPTGSFNYTWFFGDGSPEMTTTSSTISHTYSSPGCKHVIVKVTDALGTTSDDGLCLVFVDALPFQINRIGVSNSCTLESYTLTAHASGGNTYDWNNNECGLIDDREYKSYLWEARTIDGVFLSSIFTNMAACTQFDLTHAFFSDLIGTGGSKDIIVSVRVTDNSAPNITLDYETILTLRDDIVIENQKIIACPGTEIPLQLGISNSFLASSLYYDWAGNTEEATSALSCTDCPIPIVEVLNGDSEYLVQVTTLSNGCTYEATFSIVGQELIVNTTTDGTGELIACTDAQSIATLGGEPTASGGSENYTYLWSPFYNLNNSTVSNPTVIGIGVEQSQHYTLTVVDEYGCTETAEVKVIGSSSLLRADAGLDVFACFGSDVILEGSPTGIGFDYESNPLANILYKWTTSENEVVGTSEQLIFENITTQAAGLYTVQVIDPENGCNSVDEMNLFVNPEIIIPGFQAGLLEVACLGNNGGNAFTSAPNSLPVGYSFSWDPSDIVSDPESLNPLITPTAENPFAFLNIKQDGTGCSVKKMSKPWALFAKKPEVQVSYSSEGLCPGQEVCFSIFADFYYLSHQLEAFGLITPNRNIYWSIQDEFGVETASGSYSFMIDQANTTEVCTSFEHIGEYTFRIEEVSNVCGNTSFEIPINIGANNSSNLICNNNSVTNPSFVVNGLYTGVNLIISPPTCEANIFSGQTVSTIASESIIISENFLAENGSQFVAKIGEVNGCEGIMPLVQQNIPPLIPYEARDESITSSKISIYPNPFTNQLNLLIHSDTPIKKLEVFIQSSVNQTLYKTSLSDLDNQATIPIVLDQLRPGVYWCMVILDGEIYNQKIIKM